MRIQVSAGDRDHRVAGEGRSLPDIRNDLKLNLAAESGLHERIDAMCPARGSPAPGIARCCLWRCAPQDQRIFIPRVRSGEWKGHTGKHIRIVVNL